MVFGRVANYTHGEDKVACSREAFSFYAGAKELDFLECYLAAMGVSYVAQLCTLWMRSLLIVPVLWTHLKLQLLHVSPAGVQAGRWL